ncbi:MAG: hypothetical protein IK152_06800 [Lachnospiraceae bacterium]|nr:hypothetical protein [Lachnospiraceae bacterium]
MTLDSVVHDRPAFINRTHDKVAMFNTDLLLSLLMDCKYHVTLEQEDDDSITGFVEELSLVENAPDTEQCLDTIVESMKDYALDYYSQFNYWSMAPNRVGHIPYVLKLLISSDEMIREDIICRDGRS